MAADIFSQGHLDKCIAIGERERAVRTSRGVSSRLIPRWISREKQIASSQEINKTHD